MNTNNLIKTTYKGILKVFAGSGLRNIKFVEEINLFVKSKLNPGFIITKKYNHKMFLDKFDNLFLSIYGNYEALSIDLLEKEIKKGDVVLDLGANIGFYTLIFAKLVGEKGKVYAFEPDKTNFEILKKNIEVNGYSNIIPVNKAVIDENKEINFYTNKRNGAGNSIYNTKNTKILKVKSIKLDDYFKEKRRVDFIKIDIEGAEFKALKGMKNLLKENKAVKLLTEFHLKLLNKENLYLEFLEDLGFSIYEIQKDLTLKLLSNKEVLKKYNNEAVNLFWKRKRD